MSEIIFGRIPDAPFEELLRLLNEPRNTRHMPLSEPFTEEEARDWIDGKDAQWERNGYGPWAIYVDGRFAGWGGFQKEDDGADFGLVLLPELWGNGAEISRVALEVGFHELGFEEVFVLLPLSRRADRSLARLGFIALGEVDYDGVPFRQFRLRRADWRN